MNTSATSAASSAEYDAPDANSARSQTTYTAPPTTSTFYYLSFSGGGRRPSSKSIFLLHRGLTPATFLYLQVADLFPGGDPCGAFDLRSIDSHKIRPDENLVSWFKSRTPTPEMTSLISRRWKDLELPVHRTERACLPALPSFSIQPPRRAHHFQSVVKPVRSSRRSPATRPSTSSVPPSAVQRSSILPNPILPAVKISRNHSICSAFSRPEKFQPTEADPRGASRRAGHTLLTELYSSRLFVVLNIR